jgi:hypothetical protein
LWVALALAVLVVVVVAVVFAGNVGFLNVEKMVKSTDMCVLARHVANMSANMSATRPKMVPAVLLTMLRRHVAYGYVGNMSAGDLLTKILLLHVFNISTPLRHYASTPVCQYAITPLRHYAITPLRQYASTPVRQYASTSLRHYAITPVRQYASTPVCQ